MIILDRASKDIIVNRHTHCVLSPVSMSVPSDRRIALFGPSKRDKQILLSMLAGAALPTVGTCRREVRTSFLVGEMQPFSRELSVRFNVAHLARLYGFNEKRVVEAARWVIGSEGVFEKPFGLLSNETRRAVAQIIGLTLPFEFYIMGSGPVRADDALEAQCQAMFAMRAQEAGMIVSLRRFRPASNFDMSLVLHDGRLTMFETAREGWQAMQQLGISEQDEDEPASEDA